MKSTSPPGSFQLTSCRLPSQCPKARFPRCVAVMPIRELGRSSFACGKSDQQFGRGQDGMREHRMAAAASMPSWLNATVASLTSVMRLTSLERLLRVGSLWHGSDSLCRLAGRIVPPASITRTSCKVSVAGKRNFAGGDKASERENLCHRKDWTLHRIAAP
jgi:hypothetical protein